MADPQRYVPAAGRAALTGLYDTAMALTMRESAWRPRLTVAVAEGLRQGGVVVDVGCGTGTQALMIAGARPDARVVGIDGDPQALDRAAAKARSARCELVQGLADDLPLPDEEADRVILSLVLHHLEPEGKLAALREARRVLRHDGQLHVVDWGRPAGPGARAGFLALQLLDGRSNTRDHASGGWLELFGAVGLAAPRRRGRLRMPWGSLEQLVVDRQPA